MGEWQIKKLAFIPVKIIAIVISIMILIKFIYVIAGFIEDPFIETTSIPSDAVRHVMTSLILLELLILTIQFLVDEEIEPRIIIIVILTVLGRDIIVLEFQDLNYGNIFAIGFVFAITIMGLYLLKSKHIE